ncbi:diphosphate--fructose-6-phosphate 1-phosphotransferase [Brevibacillus fluminis]|uniref:Pyrophosphate--fructose 6-phosphate 1-phosphotransferase n=1 Tax=Brevibacillus fluminis TaxID=511487 RepID=A0A3M8D9L8_9BACL|nr:diphosphate--fructose-6-phosphate 1-phosphotransferase [Brevibacillus fluminis]RNB84732.1 diphosphate--fructose-6-phosphate 1-phosphotransferase [Brevibacillus fluminis]
MKGNCLIVQSGGPTSVINSTLYGIVERAKQSGTLGSIYGARYGLHGLLHGDYIDLSTIPLKELAYLRYTPGAALGSWRYKLDKTDEVDQIVAHLERNQIRYLFCIGGNGTMFLADLILAAASAKGYALQVVGVPKTIDNDLTHTDHCPGYGSAAKFFSTCLMDIAMDLGSTLTTNRVTIIETMGRNTGWLAAACGLGSKEKNEWLPRIYIPEVPFEEARFLETIERDCRERGHSLVIVAEGIVDKDGAIIGNHSHEDNVGRPQLGGVSSYLKACIETETSLTARYVQPSIWQRSSMRTSSFVDISEAYEIGKQACDYVLAGHSGDMISIQRMPNERYKVVWKPVALKKVASEERAFPLDWYDKKVNYVKQAFFNYVQPLIQGEVEIPMKNGLPVYKTLAL